MALHFREVLPADIRVRNLSVAVDESFSGAWNFRKLVQGKPKINDEEAGSSFTKILENVSADMPRGSLTAIIGASGSGKTTL
jgi:ABC-type multidrug transport system fused ATPase/permease subunit